MHFKRSRFGAGVAAFTLFVALTATAARAANDGTGDRFTRDSATVPTAVSTGIVRAAQQTTANSREPYEVVAGPDGNLWFTTIARCGYGPIGRVTPAGEFTFFNPPANKFTEGEGITAGADGNIWFIFGKGNSACPEPQHYGAGIGRITPTGVITLFPQPLKTWPNGGIATGPDGNLWFGITHGNADRVGRMTPTGKLNSDKLPKSPCDRSTPCSYTAWDFVSGPDGNMWFTTIDWGRIGRMTPQGKATMFATPFDKLSDIAAGPNELWFIGYTEIPQKKASSSEIGRMDLRGHVTKMYKCACSPTSITVGADGNVWFTTYAGTLGGGRKTYVGSICRMTPSGETTTFTDARIHDPGSITKGPDGNLWFTDYDKTTHTGGIGRITPTGEVAVFATPPSA
jgi:virginiamycin B lyase